MGTDLRAHQERDARCSVIGAVRAVLRRPPAELAPDEREHAAAQPAALDVALEGRERLGRLLRAVRERPRLVACVSYSPGACRAAARIGKPRSTSAARPESRLAKSVSG